MLSVSWKSVLFERSLPAEPRGGEAGRRNNVAAAATAPIGKLIKKPERVHISAALEETKAELTPSPSDMVGEGASEQRSDDRGDAKDL